MIERFGDDYRRYAQRTGRFLPAFERATPHHYQEQDSAQTLRQALDEYYAAEPDLLTPTSLPDEIKRRLRAHDASHVVFGCDTSARGELVLSRGWRRWP